MSTLVSLTPASAQSNSAGTQPYANDWQKVPVSLPKEPQDALSQKDLQERGNYFDKIIGSPLQLDQPQAKNLGRAFSGSITPKEEFPLDASDTVVIATFGSYKPHLSPSKKSIYTEIKLTVDTVIKAGPSAVQPKQSISELVPGGSVVLPDGRSISDGIIPNPFSLLPEHRYLLFLRYQPQGRFFTMVKSWELKDNMLFPNSAEDKEKASKGTSSYAGKAEQDVVPILQEKTKQN